MRADENTDRSVRQILMDAFDCIEREHKLRVESVIVLRRCVAFVSEERPQVTIEVHGKVLP